MIKKLKKIKVLIVDDSALVREILKKGLNEDPQFDVVGTAPDVYVARDKIVFLKPDVLSLDIEMPKMDGIDFLKRLMPQYPLPVVIVSAMAAPGARATLEALESGAVDFVLKPSVRLGSGLSEMMKEFKSKLRMASEVDVSKWKRQAKAQRYAGPKVLRGQGRNTGGSQALAGTTDKVIAIGASTGGTVALRKMINGFPANMPGTVVVQHMPPVFTRMFADGLSGTSAVEVKEAESGDRVLTGRVLIAPGDRHMEVVRSGGRYLVECRQGKKVNGHCPSVEVLFASMAEQVGSNAVGVMLTGMGRDGADGMLAMRQAGARTFAQDEASSVVFGMPRAAYETGGAERLVNIEDIDRVLIRTLEEIK
ncbi:MAG: chemotaxis response regulator protein-glutamate methylesterase [Spirochaetes bacterium]|nr:chemotaxis response regulator protein-glutamate methylesterase [Spirochaetota bacterium]